MNWHDLVPPDVAELQIAYERRQRVWRAYSTGAVGQREISQWLGLSQCRAWQLCQKAKRDKCSPVEKYMNDFRDIAVLGSMLCNAARNG